MSEPLNREELSALRVFAAAARLGSFKRAAEHLCVTPSAVSHKIKELETRCGGALFNRGVRRVTLTAEGKDLAQAASKAFGQLGEAVERIRGSSGSEPVRISVGAYFSARWLMPRLMSFRASYPDVDIDFRHQAGFPDLRELDLAIIFGPGTWRGVNKRRLIDCRMTALGRPDLAPARPCGDLSIFARTPLIHYRSRTAWRDWLTEAGAPPDLASRGPVYDEPNITIEAAVSGQGLIIGYLPVGAAEIDSKRLAPVHPLEAASRDAYWLVTRKGQPPGKAAALFTDWLIAQADE